MKTMYGIKQKYNLKDYVKYYRSRDGKGNLCNEQFGYINGIEYHTTIKGEVELTYVLGDFIGERGGYCVSQKSIIKRATPKEPNYGYREYLKNKIKQSENSIKCLEKQIKQDTQTLKELDDESNKD